MKNRSGRGSVAGHFNAPTGRRDVGWRQVLLNRRTAHTSAVAGGL